ncbi:MAG: hypothetical protein NZN28_11590 [Meiothermus sp.]|uniref:hypothetical protein n=1 Tax=Meiothermus sp. TaxID=1955249 RepID=UPI0025E22DEA|nr:hypothetical protein [Meiothermus sp.]MCS7069255.1 hypothetical protein [Meiothermus sp.]
MKATRNNDIARAGTALRKALKTSEALLQDPDPQTRLRAVHALAQAAGVLLRLAETSDLERRLEALETLLPPRKGDATWKVV